jgi:hypothetical protein
MRVISAHSRMHIHGHAGNIRAFVDAVRLKLHGSKSKKYWDLRLCRQSIYSNKKKHQNYEINYFGILYLSLMPIIISFYTIYYGRKYFVQVCLKDPEWLTIDMVNNLHQALAYSVVLGEFINQPTDNFFFQYTYNQHLIGQYILHCDENKDARMRARNEPRNGDYDYDFNYESDSDLDLPVFNLLGDTIECAGDIVKGLRYNPNW